MKSQGHGGALAFIQVPSRTGTDNPSVSVGLPVFNGEQHLAQALRALLDQTFTDLEIIISDNASTDGTRDICERFVREDRRLRYIRQPRNVGAPRNWNAVVHQAAGQYFKWASANDYCNDRFVDECLRMLQDDPRVVLAFGKTCLVDEKNGSTSDYHGDLELVEQRPSARFRRVGRQWRLNNAQSGVFRLDVLRQTRLERPYIEGDLVLMQELALHGHFRQSPGAMLYRRVGDGSMSMQLPTEQLLQFIDPLAGPGEPIVAWPRHVDRLITVVRSPIGMREKLACIGIAARDASWDRARLAREFLPLLRNGLRLSRRC
jgi:glycosyltransferase involved in cell wall biosynthesis